MLLSRWYRHTDREEEKGLSEEHYKRLLEKGKELVEEANSESGRGARKELDWMLSTLEAVGYETDGLFEELAAYGRSCKRAS